MRGARPPAAAVLNTQRQRADCPVAPSAGEEQPTQHRLEQKQNREDR